jgi:Dolichyl-phosphate-mannose-protein mannosyltransferase
MSVPRPSPRFFWPWLAVWAAVGLGIRVATVYGRPTRPPGGDPYVYYWGARLLVTGHGFISPFVYNTHHQVLQSAGYGPVYTLTLAAPMLVGLKTYFVARIWTCIVASAAVIVVGYAGKEIAGPRAGLIAACLTALYPNIWMPDEIGAGESLVPLLVGALLLCAYRFWRRPDMGRVLWFGAALGLVILTRDELASLALFCFLPLVLLARLPWKRRVALLVAGGFAACVVVAPWVGYNMSRFQKPTFVSNEVGLTLASADCDATFSGPYEGYWSFDCAANAPVTYHGDESAASAAYQSYVLSYLRHHENRILPVTLAKIGRTFGLFHPLQQINLDSQIETRPHFWALVGLFSYYGLLVLSVGGSILLRRRRVPVFPLWSICLSVVIAVAVAFGQTRYRISFEVPLVLLAATAVDWLWLRYSAYHQRTHHASRLDVPLAETGQPLEKPTPIVT